MATWEEETLIVTIDANIEMQKKVVRLEKDRDAMKKELLELKLKYCELKKEKTT